jgi:Tfp pilus assembly protein PilF
LRSYVSEIQGDSLRRREALNIVQEIVKQHPENVNMLSFHGYVLAINNQRDAAAVQLKKAVALKPNEFSIWEQLLSNYTDRKDADSLIRWSEKAARLFPNQANVHFLKGVGHYNRKEFKSAINAISRAVDLVPEEKTEELSQMHTMLGDIYNTTKQYALSDSNYNAAMRFDPRNATLLNNYAYYLSVRNTRLEDAAKMSKESLKIRPGEPTFLDTYGWILYQQGKYKEALEYIQKAVDANPNETDPTLWEHLGAVHYKLGNKDAAVAAWRRAKERGSENSSIDKMIAEGRLYE